MKIKQASDKANEALDGAAAKVERAGLTKWILVALAVVLVVLIFSWARAARATGVEHAVVQTIAPVVVKPAAVVVPTVVTPPPAVTAPSATAQQAPGNGPGTIGYAVAVGVAVYFGAVIRSHWIFCAEDDKKKKEARRCYRPLRDGMP